MTTTVVRRWGWLVSLTVLLAGVLVASGVGRAGTTPAHAADTITDDHVTVLGVGEVDGTPDVVTVGFSVRVTRSTVSDALDARAAAANHLLDALRAHGIADKDLQTTDLSLYHRYNRKTHVTTYVASESVQATIRDLSKAGATIDAAAASSPYIEVGGMSFDLSDDAELITQARDNAYADAKQKAQQYADLAGRSLGRVERITETVREPGPIFYGAAASAVAAPAGTPAPVEAGTQTVRVRVEIIWQLA
jgi:uncharacterized protein YggE